MKIRKRRMEYLSFYDHTGIEKHLRKMAQNGWLIESISNFCWTYRKIESRDIHFSVTYYPKGSDFDPQPSEEQQTFHTFCAYTGWQLACTWFQMQVFYNEQEDPIPLETDPVMEVDTLHRACRKNFLPSYFLMMIAGLALSGYFVARIFFDPIGLLSDSTHLTTGFACLCMFVLSAGELLTYYCWRGKAQKAALEGAFVDTPSIVTFQMTILVLLVGSWALWMVNLFSGDDPLRGWIGVVMCIYVFGLMFLVNGIKQALKRARASRGVNKALTLAACILIPVIVTSAVTYIALSGGLNGVIGGKASEDRSIPLSLEDFTQIDKTAYIGRDSFKHTVFLGQRSVNQYPHWEVEGAYEMPNLQYTVTTVKVPFLYNWCRDQIYRQLDESDGADIPEGHRIILREQDAAPWGAETAFRAYHEEGWWLNWYLLCYEDKIVEIRFDWEPTAEQAALVGRRMCS